MTTSFEGFKPLQRVGAPQALSRTGLPPPCPVIWRRIPYATGIDVIQPPVKVSIRSTRFTCDVTMPKYSFLVRYLIFAGALPFFACTLLVLLPLLPRFDAQALFRSYALVILSFLCGAHWGQAIAARGKAPLNLFLASNGLVLLLWLAHVFLPGTPFLLLVLLELALLLRIDHRLRASELIDHWYYITRTRITLIVAICVVLVLLA